jgi:anthranilate synthase/aminodeoxychorismate synthase-like glutamine amidotransferase
VLLLLDNYDSFTYNLYDYFVQSGAKVHVVRNDELNLDTVLSTYTGIIISPGPGVPNDAGCTMQVIERFHDQLPIFGVCLGMQAIGLFYGATLSRGLEPMHGKVSTLTMDQEHPMFANISPPLNVCRYHSLVLSHLEHTPLRVIAHAPDESPMALVHNTLPIWAVQFHPEAILTPQGKKLIYNWLAHHNLLQNSNVS